MEEKWHFKGKQLEQRHVLTYGRLWDVFDLGNNPAGSQEAVCLGGTSKRCGWKGKSG